MIQAQSGETTLIGANLYELRLAASEVPGVIDASCAFVFCDLWIKAEWASTHGFAVDNTGSDNLFGRDAIF